HRAGRRTEARGGELLVIDPGEVVRADEHDLVLEEVRGHAAIKDLAEADVLAEIREVPGRARVVDQDLPGTVDRGAPRRAEGRNPVRHQDIGRGVKIRAELADAVSRHAEAVDYRRGARVSGEAEWLDRHCDAPDHSVAILGKVRRGKYDIGQGLLTWAVKRPVSVEAAERLDRDLVNHAALDHLSDARVELARPVSKDNRRPGGDQSLPEGVIAGSLVGERDVEPDHRGAILLQD